MLSVLYELAVMSHVFIWTHCPFHRHQKLRPSPNTCKPMLDHIYCDFVVRLECNHIVRESSKIPCLEYLQIGLLSVPVQAQIRPIIYTNKCIYQIEVTAW